MRITTLFAVLPLIFFASDLKAQDCDTPVDCYEKSILQLQLARQLIESTTAELEERVAALEGELSAALLKIAALEQVQDTHTSEISSLSGLAGRVRELEDGKLDIDSIVTITFPGEGAVLSVNRRSTTVRTRVSDNCSWDSAEDDNLCRWRVRLRPFK